MTLVTNTLGFLLQGVSQQPVRVQPDGHVKESINLLPDVTRGRVSRPALSFKQKFSIPANMNYETVNVDGISFLCVYNDTTIKLIRYDTQEEYTPTNLTEHAAYYGNDMVFLGTNGEVIAVNKDKIVKQGIINDDSITDWAFVAHLGGRINSTYNMTFEYTDGTRAVAQFTPGTIPQTAGTFIAKVIRSAMRQEPSPGAHFGDPMKSTTEIIRADDILYIRDTSAGTPTVTTLDGLANTEFKFGNAVVDTFADVPRFSQNKALIKVNGDKKTGSDDVWLKFFTDNGQDIADNSLATGNPGVWKEWFEPDSAFAFDVSTMPHVITLDNTAKTFTVSAGTWKRRQAGSDKTNPKPSFVGKTIRDLGEFQSRLWFLSGSFWIASRTNLSDTFFRQTVVEQLASDPIDIKSTGEDAEDLQRGVAFEQNLLVFGKNGQFFINGSGALTPKTATIVPTTRFEASLKAEPVVAGRFILFPFKVKQFSGVNEVIATEDISFNVVSSITDNIPRYITGNIDDIAADGNANTAIMKTDDPNANTTIWVYNWLFQNNERQQQDWHKWKVPDKVEHLHAEDGAFFIWTHDGTELIMSELLIDRPPDIGITYPATLDYKRLITLDANKEFQASRGDLSFVAAAGNTAYTAGWEVKEFTVVETAAGVWTYTFADNVPDDLYTGIVYETQLWLNEPIFTDGRGTKQPAVDIVISKYVVDYTDSGEIRAYMLSKFRGNGSDPEFVFSNEFFPQDDDPIAGFDTTVKSGSFDIPWGDDNKTSSLILKSNTPLPVEYIEVRYYGQVYRRTI
mgnify:CR=1 FL=1